MNSSIQLSKIVGGVILSILWVCTFLFIKSTLVIDWTGTGATTTNFKLVVNLIGLLIIVGYHIYTYVRGNAETTKLSLTSVLTIIWLALIIFYPFKDPANTAGGAVGFFALLGGLAVVVFWVRFFSDEIVA
ncbi:MAG: hypothetical protein J2P37_33365 [Ktedonobacteraceae bacterium]|nr:hypothetical protein [Ktedonobacteraceae bacterium]